MNRSYPHRVLRLSMVLMDEETGEIVGRKFARIHEIDPAAGEIHVFSKIIEIMTDAESVFTKEAA